MTLVIGAPGRCALPAGEPAFHVVIPAVPGFPPGGPTADRGWTTPRIARAFADLMAGLGYERYGAHGGDVGSGVTRALGAVDAEHLVGGHVLELFSFPSGDEDETAQMTGDDWAALGVAQRFDAEHAGYQKLQERRPQTLAFALHDSPVGQLAWIADFWDGFGDRPSRDEQLLVETAGLYWLTGTFAASARLYWEDAHVGEDLASPAVPIGIAVAPGNFQSVRRLAERDNPTLGHWTTLDDGGHFAAVDVPDALIADLRTFFGSLER